MYSLGAVMRCVLPGSSFPALDAIAAKAMSEDPESRYAHAAAFLADLDRFQDGEAVEAWSEPLWQRLQRFGSRNAVLLWLLAAYAAVKFLLFFLRSR
jgi:hypothetical protein